MKRRAGLVCVAASAVVLAACGTSRTFVNEPVEQRVTFASVVLEERPPTVNVPDEVRSEVRAKLDKAMFDPTIGFQRGDELKVQYRFVQFNAGDRFSRWFWGGIGNAGEASMQIEAYYFDRSGKLLTRTQHEGRIGSGFFGGSLSDAGERVAKEVANFARSTFR